MKKIKLIAVCMICALSMSAQTYPGYLQITLHRNLMMGACNLDSAPNTIYIHAGAGYRNSNALWNAVVGNWGLADGVGQMTTVNDSTYTLCMDLTKTSSNYFSNQITANADSGIMPIGSTVYNIGVVFRAPSGFPVNSQGQFGLNNHLKGASDDITCSDIWVLGVNTGSIQIVEQSDGSTPVASVETAFVNGCASTGVQDISSQLIDHIIVSPNPFTETVNIQFNMIPDLTKVNAKVYDVMGRVVADLTPRIKGGYNFFSWDGAGADGNTIAAGTYLLKVTNGTQVLTKKLIKQ